MRRPVRDARAYPKGCSAQQGEDELELASLARTRTKTGSSVLKRLILSKQTPSCTPTAEANRSQFWLNHAVRQTRLFLFHPRIPLTMRFHPDRRSRGEALNGALVMHG
jgi:hypothetical protein